MLLYLRIVHSFDYYSAMEYPHEDEMPHRCGIVHCRGPVPTGQITQSEGKCGSVLLQEFTIHMFCSLLHKKVQVICSKIYEPLITSQFNFYLVWCCVVSVDWIFAL